MARAYQKNDYSVESNAVNYDEGRVPLKLKEM
jgi:hypothetical protein